MAQGLQDFQLALENREAALEYEWIKKSNRAFTVVIRS